jgi:hypothetical protein
MLCSLIPQSLNARFMQLYRMREIMQIRGTDVLLFRALTALRRGIQRIDLFMGFRGCSNFSRVPLFDFSCSALRVEVETSR